MGHIQVKDVPDELHDELRRRARLRNTTVRDYVLGLIEADQRLPTMDEWLAELEQDPPVELGATTTADAVREGREERERQLEEAFRTNAERRR